MPKILLADDHTILRQGLRSVLVNEFRMNVVGEAGNGREAIELAQSLKPDIVIMDITMPDMNGVEATRRIISEQPNVKVIALSMHIDKNFVYDMLNAGASGYLLKQCAYDEVQHAIQTVLRNKKYISPNITGVVIHDYVEQKNANQSKEADQLTSKEREILQMVAEGKSTKEIAVILHVSIPTVETHRRNIMEKLQLHSVADLTKYAIRVGLTSLE